MSGNYTIRVDEVEDGDGCYLRAEVVELPGCVAYGRDRAELGQAVAEAIGDYLSEPGHEVRIDLRRR